MKTLKINVFTSSDCFVLELGDIHNVDSLEFLKIFNHNLDENNQELEISRIQKKSEIMIAKLNLFIEQHSKIPALHKMKARINQLADGEYFIFLFNNSDLTEEEKSKIFFEVEELNGGTSAKEKYKDLRNHFAQVLDNFNIRTVDEQKKTKLGEPNKDLRKCRFCFRGKSDGATFFSLAHAISEALGNKTIIQYEECDECNSYFEKNVEKHLIQYLDIYRTFFGIKNKENKIPTLKGENFEYRKLDETTIIIKQQLRDAEDNYDPDISEGIPLKFHGKINEQNIYKSLVKFAIGIIEPNDLQRFKKTIEWLRGNDYVNKLPKVGVLADYRLYTEHPKIVVYVRKNESINFPYAIGEFHFTFFTFIFVIPIFEENEKDFTDENDYDSIWSVFKHFNISGNMVYEDFSNCTEKTFQINLKFEQNKEN